MAGFRAFEVRLPSGDRYWTVLDDEFRPVAVADEWLLHMRMGRDCAEGTVEAYARSLALFVTWCDVVGLSWPEAPARFGRFVHWLKHYEASPSSSTPREVRGPRRVNAVTGAVREFFRYAESVSLVDSAALDALYEVTEDYDLPAEARGEFGVRLRRRPRHRLSEPESVVNAVGDEELVGLLRACGNARDRFIVLGLWRLGLRRGELTGLRLADVHCVPDSSGLGCRFPGEHVHVRRRLNPNRASAKSKRSRPVPADWLVVQAYDQYMIERGSVPAARRCDFLLVNLFRGQVGGPMRPGALNDLFADLSRRAGLARPVHPHMLRHGFATNVEVAGATIDELALLLGHASTESSRIYVHPSHQRLRQAVDRVGTPRAGAPDPVGGALRGGRVSAGTPR